MSLPHRWTAAWSAPLDTTSSTSSSSGPSAWLALYTPRTLYTDHAFQCRRTGIPVLRRHWTIWRTAIPDFEMSVVEGSVWERTNDQSQTKGGGTGSNNNSTGKEEGQPRKYYSFRTVNRGTMLNDLPSKKASGKRFEFSGVVDFVVRVDEKGGELIEEVEEWYSRNFDEGNGVGKKGYHTLEEFGE